MDEMKPVIFASVYNRSEAPVTVYFNEARPAPQEIAPGSSGRFVLYSEELTEENIQFFCRTEGKEFGYLTDFVEIGYEGTIRIEILGLENHLNLIYTHRSSLGPAAG